jgi:serine/threonine-protein kinase HipA
MTQECLLVYYDQRRVGTVRLDENGGDGFLFEYHHDWLTSARRFPISLSLPLKEGKHQGPTVRYFFANLLPEGAVRRAVTRRLGLSEDNDFALLKAIGGECDLTGKPS